MIEEKLPPNYTKLDVALRSIGYSFEVAVADIIDNSIDAEANHIVVRFATSKDRPLDIVICDDGFGMNSLTLREAMRFGSNVSEELHRLGKFGLGLKLASLSQARELRVYSYRDGELSGRGWLEQGIKTGFTSMVFDERECREALRNLTPDRDVSPRGTTVLWTHLYRAGRHDEPEQQAQKLLARLKNYLGLAFHRFLSGRAKRKVSITIDILNADSRETGLPVLLQSMDPFAYERSGREGFPAQLHVEETDQNKIDIRAHIWPPNSSQPEYRLPGGANARQGFYFYRNDRLIQGGGWNGIREAEPHSSLARLEIDLASDFDVDVNLDIKKVEIQLPFTLVKAIQKAKTAAGIDFRKYLALADVTYRTRRLPTSEIPLVIGEGIPKPLQHFLSTELGVKKSHRQRKLRFEWSDLDDETFFELDRDNEIIHLNREYRRHLLHGLPGSSADLPVTKCLLFLLLREVFYSERMGSKIREKIEQANRILCAAVGYERR